jgi:hypothetical protein
MTADLKQEQQRVTECAAAALSRSWQASVLLADVTALSDENRRNLILRATALRDGTLPRSVIIKATRAAGFDAMAANAFAESGLVKEWTAAAFLAGRAPNGGHCPDFLAGDAARGLVVFEDLGAGLDSLVGPLLGGPRGQGATGPDRLRHQPRPPSRRHAGLQRRPCRGAATLLPRFGGAIARGR